jgi:hydrogenase-4 component B
MGISESVLLMATLGWPLLLIPLCGQRHLHRAYRVLMPSAALPALLLTLAPPSGIEHAIPWLLLGVSFGIDETSAVFLLFSSLLWMAGAVLIDDHTRRHFRLWFLLTMLGSFAVILARDVPTFFLGYAVMSLATFGLIFDPTQVGARRAARVYLVLAIIGEMVLLSALVMVAHSAGTLEIEHVVDRQPRNLLMALLLVGFGIKAGIPLLHVAQPPVYMALPTAAAVPVAGALLHLGLYGWLRFLPLEYPLPLELWSRIFLGCGLLAILFGSIAGLMQRNPRALLAYSSISQMGSMTLLVGLLLLQPARRDEIMAVILLFALHHALAKGALFQGLAVPGRARLGLCLAALSLAGAPWFAGAAAKSQLKLQLLTLPEPWANASTWMLTLGSIGTTLLMARFVLLTLGQKDHEKSTVPAWPGFVAWWLLLAAALVLPWLWPAQPTRIVDTGAALWPLALGIALAISAWYGRNRLPPLPRLPPGDVLVLVEKLLRPVLSTHAHHAHHAGEIAAIMHPSPRPGFAALAEQALTRWWRAMISLLVMILALLWLL